MFSPPIRTAKRQRDVRFGSKAYIATSPTNVRFTPKSGHWNSAACCYALECPLMTQTGRGGSTTKASSDYLAGAWFLPPPALSLKALAQCTFRQCPLSVKSRHQGYCLSHVDFGFRSASVLWGDEDTALRADGCFTIFVPNAPAQVDDLAIETRMLLHRNDKPFERDRFVGINRTPKPNPKFKP
jgi:hypothetical protein